MSGIVPISSAAAGGAIAAAAHAAKMREEEEKMTKYESNDLDKWEFKIVRCGFPKFKKREIVKQLCEEEAQAGWEMLEKFDDYRIRFKRLTAKRAYDQHLSIDPYRTSMRGGSNPVIWVAFGLAFIVAGLVTFFLIRFSN